MVKVSLVVVLLMMFFGTLPCVIKKIPWYPSPSEARAQFIEHEQEFEILKEMILKEADVEFVNAYEEVPRGSMKLSKLAKYKSVLNKAGVYTVAREIVKIEGNKYYLVEFDLNGPPYCNAEKISIVYSKKLIPGDMVRESDLHRPESAKNPHKSVYRCTEIKSNWFVKYYGFGSSVSFEKHISVR